jgi:hypothetical protein
MYAASVLQYLYRIQAFASDVWDKQCSAHALLCPVSQQLLLLAAPNPAMMSVSMLYRQQVIFTHLFSSNTYPNPDCNRGKLWQADDPPATWASFPALRVNVLHSCVVARVVPDLLRQRHELLAGDVGVGHTAAGQAQPLPTACRRSAHRE